MFTGIVQEIGTVTAVEELGKGRQITISCDTVRRSLELGESVSVDGACQTVSELLPGAFRVQTIATTLERTVLGEYVPGARVNLELAVALGARLGGHLVQGHVDGVGRVTKVEPRGELVLVECTLPPIVAAVTILHGSVTLNGVSLTVNALPEPGTLQVSLIPYTLAHTTLGELRVGRRVNLEGDLIGKYVRQLLRSGGSHSGVNTPRYADLLDLSVYSTEDPEDG